MHIDFRKEDTHMLFGIFRVIFWAIIFTVCLYIIKKSKISNKRLWYIFSLVATITLTTFSALFPLENAFITFSSPESAFNYNNTGNVLLVVNGESTDMVVAERNDTDVYAIIPKSDNGWKLSVGADTKKIAQNISNGITVHIYRYRNSNDYYITVLNTNGGELIVSDNYNSEFYYLTKTNKTLNETFYTYYAFIYNLNEQYSLTVNGDDFIKF